MPYTDEDLYSLLTSMVGGRRKPEQVFFDDHTREMADMCLEYLRVSMDAIMEECYRAYDLYADDGIDIGLAASLEPTCFPDEVDSYSIATGLVTPAIYNNQHDFYQGDPCRCVCLDIGGATGVEVFGDRSQDFAGWWMANRILNAVETALVEEGYDPAGVDNNPSAFYPFSYEDDGAEWSVPIYYARIGKEPYITGYAHLIDEPESAWFLYLPLNNSIAELNARLAAKLDG